MSKTWPCQSSPGGCVCRCHAIARGKAARGIPRASGRIWLPEHDALLRQAARRGDTLQQMAAGLESAHKITRSVSAIRARLGVLGESLHQGWRSQNEVAAALDVHPQEVTTWRTQGQLRWARHGGSHWVKIADADLEAFVRDHAGRLVDPLRVRDARLRSLAEVAARANSIRRAG